MIVKSRGRVEIDITPANWPTSAPMLMSWAAVVVPFATEDLTPELREFVGLFCEVRLGLDRVTATVVLPTHLADAEIEERRKRLVRLTKGTRAVVEFAANGSAKIIESSGPVALGTRASCTTGHAPAEECDLCRGVCIGGFDYPPDAKPLLAPT